MRTRYHQPFWTAFVALWVAILVAVNVVYFRLISADVSLFSLVYVWLIELAAIAFSYDTAEIMLTLATCDVVTPRRTELSSYPRVALLCCTCDDIDVDVLKQLGGQDYLNVRVYILDDSEQPQSRAAVDTLSFEVIRRPTRRGFKAGNLNNWLQRFGQAFEYVVVADADTILPSTFVSAMVRYAEHPRNARIGIFESCISAWNRSNRFARVHSAIAPLGHRQRLRVDARLGSTLSVGHNNLIRTKCLFEVGGFDERYLAEDFATTVTIVRHGRWSCRTVPVVSFERAPQNLIEYARRQARWAYQTIQLVTVPLAGLDLPLRVRLVRAVLFYSDAVLLWVALALVLTSNLIAWSAHRVDSSNLGLLWRVWFAVGWAGFVLVPLILRSIVMRQNGVSIRTSCQSMILHGALAISTTWPVCRRLLSSIGGDRIGFDATGRSPAPSLSRILAVGCPSYVLIWMVLVASLMNPSLGGVNLPWLILAALSPLIVYAHQGSEA